MASPGDKVFQVDDPQFEEIESSDAQVSSQRLPEHLQVDLPKDKPACQKKHRNQGGYECEFVQLPPEAVQTDCSICLQILRAPHLISCCGHNFCQTCINFIKTNGKSCPLCNDASFSLMHNKGLERSLKGFEVRCTYFKHGCEWVDKLGLLEDHLNMDLSSDKQLEGCDFVEIECSHDCGGYFQRCLLAHHQEDECPKRPYSCDYCRDYASTFEDVANNHWPECKCYPLFCPKHCTPYAIERQNLQHHIIEECPLTVIKCDFHYAGCEVQLPRKNMPAHLRESFNHMSLLAALNQKLMKMLLDKDKEIDRLSHEMKEMSAQHDKGLKLYFEQQSQTLADQLAKFKDEIVALKQEFYNEAAGVRECAALRQEIDQLKEKQGLNLDNLDKLKEQQGKDRIELQRQAIALQYVNVGIVVPIKITMSDFERYKAADDEWYSEPFCTHPGGYKLCLRVDANGWIICEGTHISVCVYLMQGEFDDHLKWPLLCSITIQLLNKGGKHHKRTFGFGARDHKDALRLTKGERARSGWGTWDFISLDDFYSHCNQYLNDDCIHFQVTKVLHL